MRSRSVLSMSKKERDAAGVDLRGAPVVEFKGGAISTASPRYGLIWLSAMRAGALRFMRGVRIKGEAAVNALSANQDNCDDKEFVINRLEHVIEHSYMAIARLKGTMEPCSAEEEADGGDAGAVIFGGALLAEHYDRARKAVKG